MSSRCFLGTGVPGNSSGSLVNGHFRNRKWRYLPYIRPIFQALISGNIPRTYGPKYGTFTYLHKLDPEDLPLIWAPPRDFGYRGLMGPSQGLSNEADLFAPPADVQRTQRRLVLSDEHLGSGGLC
jgi:hypothetical protein